MREREREGWREREGGGSERRGGKFCDRVGLLSG